MPLDEILGHRPVIDAFITAHHRGRLHHAWLFSGPKGVGKRLTAIALAAFVNCTGDAPTDDTGRRTDACGVCRSCRQILAADDDGPTHPDLHLLVPDGKQIKIAQVREVIRRVPYPPIEARERFVIIDPADALNEPAANALLKTLEEPAPRTRFILISSRADALLTTIISRCQRVTFGRLDDADVETALIERLELAPDVAKRVVSLAEGSLGNALDLVENPVLAERDDLIEALLGIAPGDRLAAFFLAARLADFRGHLPTVFDLLARTMRDLLILRAGSDLPLLAPDHRALLTKRAETLGDAAILHRLNMIDDTRRGVIHRNLNARMALERLIADLSAPPGMEVARTLLGSTQRH